MPRAHGAQLGDDLGDGVVDGPAAAQARTARNRRSCSCAASGSPSGPGSGGAVMTGSGRRAGTRSGGGSGWWLGVGVSSCRAVGAPPSDPALWAGLDELTAELGWECPYCAGPLKLDVRLVEVGAPGLVNVLEAWCEVCSLRWFPPRELRVQG